MNKEIILEKDIVYFFDKYWIGKIQCRKCSYVRTSWERPNKPMSEKEKKKRADRLKEKCPKCGRIHQYEVEVVRHLVDESDESIEDKMSRVFRTRLFKCPRVDESFQYRFPLIEDAGTKIIEVEVRRTLKDDNAPKESADTAYKAESDPFMDEVRQKYNLGVEMI